MNQELGRLTGVIPAVATPFCENEDIDEKTLRELLNWYIDAGVHGISVGGSQGEFFSLDADERSKVLKITMEVVEGRVPVYAGTGAITTRESIRITREAEAMGVDVAMLITPYFIQPRPDELVSHFTDIARSTRLPVLLYNNPPRTSVNVSPDVFARCYEVDNIIGVKDSSGDMTQIIEYLRVSGRRAMVYSGRDTLILDIILHGGAGAISPAANVFPRLVIRLYDAVKSGDLDTAKEIGDVLAPLRMAWEWASFPVVIKEAMALVGRGNGIARAPIQGLSAEKRSALAKVIETISKYEAAGA
ncbi:MAG: dihydrodipicolinate synthase family protein [marine bacterium B5-7]|nr:MAG: dihydrodipicolinate synthase family protein [marine bacterium B5-7]